LGIQQNIGNISKLGYWLDILVNDDGEIIVGVFTKPSGKDGTSSSVLNPANEMGADLDDVLNRVVKRLEKHIKEQGND